jgi:hypothetical protein
LREEPLTLTLSRRERGLIVVFVRAATTCDTESNSRFEKPLTLTLSRRERGLIAVFWRVAPTCDTESNSRFEKPLTLTLSRGERGLTVVFVRAATTCDTESNSDVEQHGDRLPFPLAPRGGEGWGEGDGSKAHHKNVIKKKPLKTQGLFHQCG